MSGSGWGSPHTRPSCSPAFTPARGGSTWSAATATCGGTRARCSRISLRWQLPKDTSRVSIRHSWTPKSTTCSGLTGRPSMHSHSSAWERPRDLPACSPRARGLRARKLRRGRRVADAGAGRWTEAPIPADAQSVVRQLVTVAAVDGLEPGIYDADLNLVARRDERELREA